MAGPNRIRITDVVVGDRARKDYGDLTSLMDSITEHGLLQPIGVLPGSRLLFGGRRLEACKRLGWESIPFVRPTTKGDALALLKAERDENTCRKDMAPSELVALGESIRAMEEAQARERQVEAGRTFGRGADSFASTEAKLSAMPVTDEVVGAALGLSKSAYFRARYVAKTAADDSQPEHVREIARSAMQKLDAGKTGYGGAYQATRNAVRAESAEPPLNSSGKVIAGGEQPKRPGRPSTRHIIKAANVRKITERLGRGR